MRTYPEALRFHSTHVLNHRGSITWNRNPLLGQYPGADGLKTGWTNASGYNLIFTAAQGNHRLLAVIMGAPDGRTRSIEAFRLLDAGFKVCTNQAVSVTAALDTLPPNAYHPDPHLLAREASRLYAGADQPARKQHDAQGRPTGQTAQSRQSQKPPARKPPATSAPMVRPPAAWPPPTPAS